MLMVFINEMSRYLAILLTFMTLILMTNCARKGPKSRENNSANVTNRASPTVPDDANQPDSDANYDETQENMQTFELQEDPLANVRLLTPNMPGNCNDENAAKESAHRHKTNQYFPRLEIQTKRICNNTSPEDLQKLLDDLPPHPAQRFRSEIKEPSLAERTARWKDVHVNWHEVGLVYLVRSQDACRSKDDGGENTADSPSGKAADAAAAAASRGEDSKAANSEMPMSENKSPEKTKSRTRVASSGQPRSKNSRERTPKSQQPSEERKLAVTQEETAQNEGKTPHGTTPHAVPPRMAASVGRQKSNTPLNSAIE